MANIRVYNGEAIGQIELSALGLGVGRPPEPKVVGSTPASRTSLRFVVSLVESMEPRLLNRFNHVA